MLMRSGYAVSGYPDPVHTLDAFRAHPQDCDVLVTDFRCRP